MEERDMTGTVHLICGKICSGKSYYAKKLKEKENAVIFSTDEVTWDLTRNEQGDSYDEFARQVNLYLRKKAAEIAGAGANVILDWGFWTKRDRREMSEYMTDHNVPYTWHYIDVPDDLWQRNIAERNERVSKGEGGSDFFVDEGLLNKLNSLFEAPEKDEIGVWYTPEM